MVHIQLVQSAGRNRYNVFSRLATILVGGEKLSEQHIKKLIQTYVDLKIINGYGPTENTTFSLTYKIAERRYQFYSHGCPISNRIAYIVDAMAEYLL